MIFQKLNQILLSDYYAVPDYQRDYEWTDSQTTTLLDDIFNIMEQASNKTHFFGAIVTIPFEEENAVTKILNLDDYDIRTDNVKHLVDGQQRLITFSLLIKALIDLIDNDKSLATQNSAHKKEKLKDKLKPMLVGCDFTQNDLVAPKLLLNKETGKCYNYL